MKSASIFLLATVLAASPTLAGGPIVVVEEEEVVVEEKAGSSTGFLPLLLIPLAICIVLCSDEDEPLPP